MITGTGGTVGRDHSHDAADPEWTDYMLGKTLLSREQSR